jgi:ABC-type antimicrobial peptide transport system permease subunit
MPSAQVQRQIVLPLSKAIEIAYKSIRLRLSRSLLVTSGIVLALAFLTSILISDRMTDGMRNWAANFPASGEFKALSQQRSQLQAGRFDPVDAELHKASMRGEKLVEGTPRVDPSKLFGDSLGDLQRDLGLPLPGPENDLVMAMSLHPELVATMREWIDAARQLKMVREKLIAPQRLQEIMKNAGVPSTDKEIQSNRIQTRWLIGLALLVAFVGILNAMLMSVTERFREIGTMKCLGALDSFIIKLFLIESLFQGIVGTVVGIVLGTGLSMANLSSSYGVYAWKNVPWNSLVLCVVVCLTVGIVLTVAGALYPAWQAARMQPIEAMRVEA